MKLVDTHCHLDLADFKSDLGRVIENAAARDVARIIAPGIDLESSRRCVEIAAENPFVFAAAGVHPHDADKADDKTLASIRQLAVNSDKVVAIGEVGLDYYRKYSGPENQKKIFSRFVEMAIELDLPLIMHSREAHADLIDILKKYAAFPMRGVMHCFSGDEKVLEETLAMGFFVSFAGNITYEKASGLRDIARIVPPERLLLETDAPYMTPDPERGKRNEPAFLGYLLGVYADIYGLSREDIARITTHNANKLFLLGLDEERKIAYPIRNSLYLNITNRCTNRCTFCTRYVSNYVKGHNLQLLKEPETGEIIESMGDVSRYREIVFCGFGEPTLRLDVIKKVSAYVKKKGCKVRLVTNGEGDLISSRPIAPELKGLVDTVSVSLNAPDAKSYNEVCRSVFGEAAYKSIAEFVRNCRKENIAVELTCLDLIGEKAVAKCMDLAKSLDAVFRLREHNVVG